MNTLGSFTAKEDVTHHKGVMAEGFGVHNLSTTPVTGTTYNVATANLTNFGYSQVTVSATGANVYQLDIPMVVGLRKTIHCLTTYSTAAALVYAGSTAFEACFLTAASNTSNSLATMYRGTVLELLAVSTNKWLVTGNCTAGSTVAASFSSST